MNNAPLITLDNAIWVEGALQFREGEPPKLIVNSMHPLIENDKYIPQEPLTTRLRPESKVTEQPISPRASSSASVSPNRAQKLYLRVPDMSGYVFRKVENLLEIFDGFLPVIYYDNSTKTYIPSDRRISLSPVCFAELKLLLGEENVVPK